MLLIDLNKRMVAGSCRAGDVKKFGLLEASIKHTKKLDSKDELNDFIRSLERYDK